MLRPTVVGLACRVGVPECVDDVMAAFKKWITNTTSVPKPHPDLRSIVYSYGKYELCDLQTFASNQGASGKMGRVYYT